MITGPFCPLAPSWIWAAVAFMLLISTRPVMTLSPMTVIELRPERLGVHGRNFLGPAQAIRVCPPTRSIFFSIPSIFAHPLRARTAVEHRSHLHIVRFR